MLYIGYVKLVKKIKKYRKYAMDLVTCAIDIYTGNAVKYYCIKKTGEEL